MTNLTHSRTSIGRRLPSKSECDSAKVLHRALKETVNENAKLALVDSSGKRMEVALEPGLSEFLLQALQHIGNGDAVKLEPLTKELTTQEAAVLLNTSNAYVIDLLTKGDINHSNLGRQRLVKTEDVFNYKETRDSIRSAALEELALMDSEFI